MFITNSLQTKNFRISFAIYQIVHPLRVLVARLLYILSKRLKSIRNIHTIKPIVCVHRRDYKGARHRKHAKQETSFRIPLLVGRHRPYDS